MNEEHHLAPLHTLPVCFISDDDDDEWSAGQCDAGLTSSERSADAHTHEQEYKHARGFPWEVLSRQLAVAMETPQQQEASDTLSFT